ncbi:hypothetical protein LV85_01369 [Algoriphagus chordae]|uniref:Uncharacterized protein n=1 Tax=Algoriphagus chordae TaxID=237019 RepID=A0A2W7R6R1_9BACT|nr:hypothetical protein LV85_01369 [Algoriphagus chordae]
MNLSELFSLETLNGITQISSVFVVLWDIVKVLKKNKENIIPNLILFD